MVNAKLHNFFTFEVYTDGILKQTARAENIVLNGMFSSLGAGQYYEYWRYHLYICVGRGTGTLARTRTSLFSQIVRRSASLVSYGTDGNTGWVTREITLGVTEFNGEVLTEVGFSAGSAAGYEMLETHALLQDSEGNPITITKQDTDILIVRGTFYVSLSPGTSLGATGVYNADELSTLYRHLLSGNSENWRCYYLNRWPLTDVFEAEHWDEQLTEARWNANRTKYARAAGFKTSGDRVELGGTFDSVNLTITLPITTLTDADYTNQVIRSIGGRGGMINLPNHDFFPPYSIVGKAVGIGNGVTTSFNIGVPVIMPGTDVIKVDGVTKVRNTDYFIEYDNNCVDMYENFFTCQYGVFSSNVSFGTAKTQSPTNSTNTFLHDPLLWATGVLKAGGKCKLPASINVTAADPIWFDFLEAKRCNTMKVVGPTIPPAQIDNIVIEYSTDNSTWVAVSDKVRSGQVYTWTIAEARYWRVYIPDYTWAYPLSTGYGKSVNGSTYYATFFLGIQTPGLRFAVAPANNAVITADMQIDVLYKTVNNVLRYQWAIKVGFGEGS